MFSQQEQSLLKVFQRKQQEQQQQIDLIIYPKDFKFIPNKQNQVKNASKQSVQKQLQNEKTKSSQKSKNQQKKDLQFYTQSKQTKIIHQQKIQSNLELKTKQVFVRQNQYSQNLNQQKQNQYPQKYQTCIKCKQNLSYQNIAILSENEKYCEECLLQILQQQQKQQIQKQQRFIYYTKFQSAFYQNQSQLENQNQLKQISQERYFIQMHQEQLKIIYQNIQNCKNQFQRLKNQVIFMQAQQQKFWEQINRFDKRAIKLQQKSLNAKFDKQSAKNQIQKISKTSIIHLFTKIQIDDNIGYILGLPMGKRVDINQINWDDLNTGLGHICMSINYLKTKYEYQYIKIDKIKIKGSLTQILLKNKKQYYLLRYLYQQDQSIFGQLMQALMIETLRLSQLIQQVQKLQYSQQMKLPFKINEKQGMIGQYYIDPSKIDERKRWSQWTKALRYFLINFKHILTVYSITDNYI